MGSLYIYTSQVSSRFSGKVLKSTLSFEELAEGETIYPHRRIKMSLCSIVVLKVYNGA